MATRLDLAYDREVHRVRTRVDSLALSSWDSLSSWRDDDYARILKSLAPRLMVGRQTIANLTDAYIRKLGIATFGKVKDGAVFKPTMKALRGVSDADVFHRPFASVYAALSEGKSLSAAVSEGRTRLAHVTATGNQLAKTHAARAAISRTKFTKFQRTLTGRENCAMCVIASTQRYHRGDLLPIHPGCDCGVKPFETDADYQVIDQALLDLTHEQATSKTGDFDWGARNLGLGKHLDNSKLSDYTELIVTRDHGEIGPTLTWRSDKFTGPTDLK